MNLESVTMFSSGQRWKTIVCLMLLLLLSEGALARIIYSKGTGNWTATGTWAGGVVPVSGDTVVIQTPHSVSVTGNLYSNSTYMFLVILGKLDLTNNGKMSFNATSNIIIETGGQLLGNNNADQISIGTGSPEYNGSLNSITGPSYINNGHPPVSGGGTGGCGCYNGLSSCTITSTAGYKVHLLVYATQIVVHTNPCTWGYNYDVRLNYSVTFSGTNIPSELYTLQGNVHCGIASLSFSLPKNGGSGSVVTNGNAWTDKTNCGSVTPENLGCLNATMLIEGPGISSGTSCSAPLPINLLRFDAKPTVEGGLLMWTTAMEKNFDRFEIQKASDELLFTSIAEVPGKGGLNINVSYDFLDKNISSGKNYYRLKSVDLDGSYEYSKVVLVNWVGQDGIRLYPNPLNDYVFSIELNDKMATPAIMRLFNQTGNVMYEARIEESTSSIQLPKTIPPGLYYVRLSDFVKQETIKVVIY